MTETEVMDRLGRLLADGTIRRLGVVVRHQELGYRANAMVVWALPEERVTELGQRIGGLPFVTLSYRRPQRPGWPYNLFTMIHGRDRAAVLAQVDRIKELCGLNDVDCAVLFSGRRFKQRGARYGAAPAAQPRDRVPGPVLADPVPQPGPKEQPRRPGTTSTPTCTHDGPYPSAPPPSFRVAHPLAGRPPQLRRGDARRR